MTNRSGIFRRILLPLAGIEDAEKTCIAVEKYLKDEIEHILIVHVIEKAGGGIDKAPLSQRQTDAESIYEFVVNRFSNAEFSIDTRTLYGRSISNTIFDAANESDVDAIVFSPREANRLVNILSGDVAYSLITKNDKPVIVLPNE